MAADFEADLLARLPVLRRFALSLCRNPDTADDLVQITVEKAILGRAGFDPATRLDAWLFRILRNAWIDMTRRHRTRGTEIDVGDIPEVATVDGRRLTEARLMLDAAARALESLPVEQREVLILVCYEELSYAEAAQVLGIPVGTVMSRLSRGRIALAEKLGMP
jgi:RNA polymerase sigma-70 factor (ECF subfamily)